MAKMENTKMEVSLNQQDRRLLRNLTKAIDRLARTKWDETDGASGVKRLTEPAHTEEFECGYQEGVDETVAIATQIPRHVALSEV